MIVVVPPAAPVAVATPVPETMEPIAVLLLLHVPPVVGSVNVVELP